MGEWTIGVAELAAFVKHLAQEERSGGTVEKYLRDVEKLAR